MACYAGATVDITRVVSWHVLESVWDRQSGKSPIMQVLREINAREEQVGITKTAWYYVGADPVDTNLATDSVYGGVYAGARLWVQAMDALLAVLALGGIVGDDGIRWTVTDVSTIRTALLAAVGSSSGTRLTNAKLLEKWKAIIEGLRDALDAIEEMTSAAWTASYIEIYLVTEANALNSGYENSYDSGCKVQRDISGVLHNAFDWRNGAGGNSFPGISTGHDMAEAFSDVSVSPSASWASSYGRGALWVGHTFCDDLIVNLNTAPFFPGWPWDGWTFTRTLDSGYTNACKTSPDADGYIIGPAEEDLPGVIQALADNCIAFWDALWEPSTIGWYCYNEFKAEFQYNISFSGTLAPGTEIDIVIALTSVAVSGVSNECDGTWDDNLYSATHDDTDADGVHSIGERTLTMTDAAVDTTPDGTYTGGVSFVADANNFAAAAARAVLTVNGDAGSLITWTDGVLAGGNYGSGSGTRIRLATCKDALNRHHLDA